jgi:periplasmic protein TonB
MKSILMAASLLLGLSIPAFAQSDSAKPVDSAKSDDTGKPADSARQADNAAPHKVNYEVIKGYKIHDATPWYPPLAAKAHIQGDVILHAIIDTTGNVTRLRVLSGHPLLAQSALDAVKQWKYRPYLLEGKPVEVDTTITVKFHL